MKIRAFVVQRLCSYIRHAGNGMVAGSKKAGWPDRSFMIRRKFPMPRITRLWKTRLMIWGRAGRFMRAGRRAVSSQSSRCHGAGSDAVDMYLMASGKKRRTGGSIPGWTIRIRRAFCNIRSWRQHRTENRAAGWITWYSSRYRMRCRYFREKKLIKECGKSGEKLTATVWCVFVLTMLVVKTWIERQKSRRRI